MLTNTKIRKAIESDNVTIRRLLETVKLPTESVEGGTATFFIAELDGSVAGIAGFEFYGRDALLRSVAVPPQLQKKGIGEKVVDSMIAIARKQHFTRIILLTETAEQLFKRKGFTVVDRAGIHNEALQRSTEFTTACPKSAVCMELIL